MGADVLKCGVFADLPAPQCSCFQALVNTVVLTHKGIFIHRSTVRGDCGQGFAKLNLFPLWQCLPLCDFFLRVVVLFNGRAGVERRK